MKLDFSNVIGKHKDKPAFVALHGPSLNPFISRMTEFAEKNFVIIGCNEWYHIYPSTPPTYWILANTINTMRSESGRTNSIIGKTTVCYAESVDLTDREWVAANIQCDYLPYDQKHFGGQLCYERRCCHQIIPGRLTIQEELRKLTGAEKCYTTGASVCLHSLAFAVLFGCNPIYVAGMDLDYKLGYANNNDNLIAKVDQDTLAHFQGDILTDAYLINDSAQKIGTKIINVNPNSTFKGLEIGTV